MMSIQLIWPLYLMRCVKAKGVTACFQTRRNCPQAVRIPRNLYERLDPFLAKHDNKGLCRETAVGKSTGALCLK